MNENKNIRFNVIDVIVVVLILACIVGFVFRGTLKEKIGKMLSADTAYVTLCVENVPADQVSAFVQGSDAFIDGKKIGVLIGYSYTEQQNVVLALNETFEYRTEDDGSASYVKKTSPEFVNVYDPANYTVVCLVQVAGQDKVDGFYLNGVEYIGVGKMLNISTGNLLFTMTITEISEKAS
jgi:hypothetical protein